MCVIDALLLFYIVYVTFLSIMSFCAVIFLGNSLKVYAFICHHVHI